MEQAEQAAVVSNVKRIGDFCFGPAIAGDQPQRKQILIISCQGLQDHLSTSLPATLTTPFSRRAKKYVGVISCGSS